MRISAINFHLLLMCDCRQFVFKPKPAATAAAREASPSLSTLAMPPPPTFRRAPAAPTDMRPPARPAPSLPVLQQPRPTYPNASHSRHTAIPPSDIPPRFADTPRPGAQSTSVPLSAVRTNGGSVGSAPRRAFKANPPPAQTPRRSAETGQSS